MIFSIKQLIAIFSAIIFFSGYASAVEYLQGFPNSTPKQIVADNAGRFYLDYGKSVLIYTRGKPRTVKLTNKFGRMKVNSRTTTVNGDGQIITFTTASYSETRTYYVDGKLQTMTVVVESGSFIEVCVPRCSYKRVTGKLNNSNFIKDAKGRVFYTISKTKGGSKYYINNNQVNKKNYLQEQRKSLPALIYAKQNDIVDDEIVIKPSSSRTGNLKPVRFRGSYSTVWDSNNNPHVLFHDPEDRNFKHYYFNRQDEQIYEAEVDFSESGYENVAFVDGDSIWTIHYFYRDPFNKGLLASKLNNAGQIINQFVIDASQKRNVGWGLRGARGSDGQILITYQTDKDANTRVFLLLDGIEDLVRMGGNLTTYAHRDGPGKVGQLSAFEQQELGRELSDSFRKELKSYALSVGVGAQYAFWHLAAESELDYDIDDAIVNLVEFQGKLFNVDYGVEYAEEVVESNVVSSDKSKNVVQYIGAYVGWEKLLYNYDFKLSLEQSKTKVKLTDKTDSTKIDYKMDYLAVKLSLLDQQRTQFGFLYQKFNQYRKIGRYTYNTSPGWQFNSEGLGELESEIYAFHYGYTTINYLEKYGVSENRAYFDLEARAGIVNYTFKGPSTAAWGEEPDLGTTIMFGGQIEAGWVWFRRWKSLWNAGGYIKVGYRVNFDHYPDEEPGEETQGTDGEVRYVMDSASILRHGPLVMMAVTF